MMSAIRRAPLRGGYQLPKGVIWWDIRETNLL